MWFNPEDGLQNLFLPGREPQKRPPEGKLPWRRLEGDLQAYFQGKARDFFYPLDLSMLTPFYRQVLQQLRHVNFGSTCTYGELSRMVAAAGAARATGRALSANPLPVIIPCHRVIRSDGTLGGYTGGPDWKEQLLSLEGVILTGQQSRGKNTRAERDGDGNVPGGQRIMTE